MSARALVRATSSPEKVTGLRAQGVDVVEADVREAASLDAACAGVDAVICTVSSMPFSYEPGVNDIQTTDLDGVTTLVDAGAHCPERGPGAGGPQALSQLEAKEVFEEVLGRPVATTSVPVEALQGQLAAATDPMQQSFTGLMLCVAKGDAIDMSSLLPQFPVQLTTVKQFVSG